MFDRSRGGATGGATGFACTDDDVGSWSAGRTSSRLTTGLGPVSSGSPLTSGVGAHSLSVAFALLPRSADPVVASPDDSSGGAGSSRS